MITPAAAANALLPVITAEPTRGVVLGSFSKAVIIGVPTAGGQRIVSLLRQGAVGVPNGIRITGDASLNGIRPGEPALVGAGGIEIGALSIRMVRTWDATVRKIRPADAQVARLREAAAHSERGVEGATIGHLNTALNTGSGLPGAIDALIGLGQGLTPGGDDIVAGLMIALHAVGAVQLAQQIGERALRNRTTALSADLLRLARDGHACLEALAVLSVLNRPAVSHRTGVPVTDAIDRLLSIGHTSGADLATGMEIGLAIGAGMREGR